MYWHDNLFKQLSKLKQTKILQTLRQECGSILIFTAVAIPTLLGLVGFAFDVGNLYMHKARLQNVADAAALAGARAYLDNLDTTEGGTVNNGDTKDNPSHANEVAREYITKNSINLPNEINHDFNSLKIRESDASNTLYPNKTFYRIGLYEYVNLYFLPVISTIPKTQKVRAEAIAIAIPGTPGSSEGGLVINTNNFNSIFDNLITYSNSLDMRHTAKYNVGDDTFKVFAHFDGDIAYTHLNGLTDDDAEASTEKFYQHTISDGDSENSTWSHLQTNTTTKNDPVINTFYDTKAYLWSFQSKLLKYKHFDITSATGYKPFIVPENFPSVTNQQSCTYYKINESGVDHLYLKNSSRVFNRFYYDSEGNPQLSYVQKNGIKYQICYYAYPTEQNNVQDFVLCGKRDGDSKYYLLQVSGNNTYDVTNEYIGEKITTETIVHNEYYTEVKTTWNPVKSIELSEIKSNSLYVWKNIWADINNNKFTVSNSEEGQDIYHVSGAILPDQNVTIKMTKALKGTSTKPVYIILDADVNQDLNFICQNLETTGRPVIFVYFGTLKIICDFEGTQKFIGTIYAPNTKIEIHKFCENFEGSFICKDFFYQADDQHVTKWKHVNHLTNDVEVNNVTNAIKANIQNSKETIDNLLKDTESDSDLIDTISSKLGIEKENLANMDYYMNLTLAQKKQLYRNWKAYYEDPQTPENIKNLLWPFNGLFTMNQSSSEGGQTEGTPDNIRLINPRIEKNPFTIYNVEWKML